MGRILSFPEPLPDEDFRSTIYRYHLMSPNVIFPDSKKKLFGQRSHKNVHIPTNISELLISLPPGHTFTLDEILSQHTWASFITCFYTEESRNKMVKVSEYGYKSGARKVNNHLSGFLSHQVRYCPDCIKTDDTKYGVPYVHRVHQLLFLDFCPEHYTQLLEICPYCKLPLTKEYAEVLLSKPYCMNCQGDINAKQINKNDPINQFKFRMVRDICEIRDNSKVINVEYIKMKIMMKLWDMGFIHYRGRVNKLEFLEEISRNYSPEEIKICGVPTGGIFSKGYLGRFLTYTDIRTNMLFYVLIIQHLFNGISNFLSYDNPISNPIPYGNGPWKCLNTICTGYQEYVVNKCGRKSKGSGGSTITVEFHCPYCGYIYSRLWKPGKDETSKPQIVSKGYLWAQVVYELYNKGYSAYQIHKETGFAETGLNSFLNRLRDKEKQEDAISRGLLETISQIATSNEVVDRDHYRNVLLKTSQEKGTTKRIFILRAHTREFKWLNRYDSDWLGQHFPRKRKVKDKIDLSEFDNSLKDSIERVSLELKISHPAQIKKGTILNKLLPIEKSRFLGMSDRLPKSNESMNQSIEELNAYLLRVINRVYYKLKKRGYQVVTFNALCSRCHLFKQCDPITKDKIEILLIQLNEEAD